MIRFWDSGLAKREWEGEVIGIDPSEGMLAVAKKKLPMHPFIVGEAAKLPLEDAQCDVVSIAYGIRNVVAIEAALGEFFRVLKPGGTLLILEFLRPARQGMMNRLSSLYLNRMLPLVGGVVSGNYKAYRYLPDSIGAFVTPEEMEALLKKAGFADVRITPEAFGVSWRIRGTKR